MLIRQQMKTHSGRSHTSLLRIWDFPVFQVYPRAQAMPALYGKVKQRTKLSFAKIKYLLNRNCTVLGSGVWIGLGERWEWLSVSEKETYLFIKWKGDQSRLSPGALDETSLATGMDCAGLPEHRNSEGRACSIFRANRAFFFFFSWGERAFTWLFK